MYIMPNIMYAAIKAFDIYIYWHFIGDWGESQWIENINKDRWEDWIEFLKLKGRYNTMVRRNGSNASNISKTTKIFIVYPQKTKKFILQIT